MAKTVIVATGLVERKLEIPGEAEYFGRGVSYCATCDGAFCKGKTVVVVGGGNSALGSALYLSDLAEKVYLVHRRADFRGDFALQEKIKARKNIELVLGYVPTEIIGDGKKATGIKLAKRAELAVMKTAKDEPAEAAQGTDAPVTRELQTDAVFVAIGKTPANQLIKDLVELDGNGYAITDEHCTTKTEGLFVAGDGRAKELHQLVTATADGAIAAHSAIKFLH